MTTPLEPPGCPLCGIPPEASGKHYCPWLDPFWQKQLDANAQDRAMRGGDVLAFDKRFVRPRA